MQIIAHPRVYPYLFYIPDCPIMIDDNRKIGIGLCLLGLVCFFLGVIFFFDRALLALGNMAFLVGLSFLLGIHKTSRFFLRKEKATGSVCFFAGFALVIYGYAFVGFLVEAYGFWKLFAAFLPNVVHSLKLIPGVGFILSVPPLKWVVVVAGVSAGAADSNRDSFR